MLGPRVQVQARFVVKGLSPTAAWELLRRTTADGRSRVTGSVAPYLLDTERPESSDHPDALPTGTWRDVEELAEGVRIRLIRWVDCPSYVARQLEGHHTDELVALVTAVRRAAGETRRLSRRRLGEIITVRRQDLQWELPVTAQKPVAESQRAKT